MKEEKIQSYFCTSMCESIPVQANIQKYVSTHFTTLFMVIRFFFPVVHLLVFLDCEMLIMVVKAEIVTIKMLIYYKLQWNR